MDKYIVEDMEEALHIVTSINSRCDKAQMKLVEGTLNYLASKNDKSNINFKIFDN